jgi:hypothetical protein
VTGLGSGGTGTGGSSIVTLIGAALEVGDNLRLASGGAGGFGNGDFGAGQGGITRLAIGPAEGDLARLDARNVILDSTGNGGNVPSETSLAALADTAGTGGAGSGGTATVIVEGTLATDTLFVSANGEGGRGRDDCRWRRGGRQRRPGRHCVRRVPRRHQQSDRPGDHRRRHRREWRLLRRRDGGRRRRQRQRRHRSLLSTGGRATVSEFLVVSALGLGGSGAPGAGGGDAGGGSGGAGGDGTGGTINLDSATMARSPCPPPASMRPAAAGSALPAARACPVPMAEPAAAGSAVRSTSTRPKAS